MDYKIKLDAIAGNLQVKEEILSELSERVKTAKYDMETIESQKQRLHAVIGGLSGVNELVSALEKVSDASFIIAKV